MKLALSPLTRATVGRPAPARPRRFNRLLVTADFEHADGRRWSNLGGGATISEALESARGDLGSDWDVVRWNHAYG